MTEQTNETDVVRQLVRHASFAADMVGIDSMSSSLTQAEITRLELTAALELLIGNGLIKVVPLDEWPEYVNMTPPYDKGPFETEQEA